MLRSILVPLDGSAFAAQALPAAAALARRLGAAVRLVAVHPPLAIPAPFSGAPEYVAALDDAQRQALRQAVDADAARLASDWGVETRAAVLDGDPVEALAAEAECGGADLVVMTTHGRGGLARAWLGSVADELVRRAPVPILLIRPDAPDGARGDAADRPAHSPAADAASLVLDPAAARFRRVLVPLDGSALAEEIVGPALALASGEDATLVLLRVVRVPYTIAPAAETYWLPGEAAAIAAGREQAAEYLDAMAARLRASGLAVEPVVVAHHDPARAILDEAKARGVDLVAVATHAVAGMARLRLGSVADKIVRASPCPVLVARPGAAR